MRKEVEIKETCIYFRRKKLYYHKQRQKAKPKLFIFYFSQEKKGSLKIPPNLEVVVGRNHVFPKGNDGGF